MNKIIISIVLSLTVVITASPVFAQTPPNEAVSTDTSANWSGYVATGNTYAGVGGTWTIPAPSINNSSRVAADATWIGIGGVSSKDLIQAGTQAIVQNGAVTYQAWYETLPQYQQTISLAVHGGDSVTVSLKETSANNWQLSFTNNTTGAQYQTSITYASSHSSADWIEEMPIGGVGRINKYLSLDNFGTAQFTNAYAIVNGSEVSLAAAGAEPLTMVAGRQALATPSALNSDGAGFSIARSSVSAPSQYAQSGRGWRRTGVGIQSFTRGQRNGRFSRWQTLIPSSFGRFRNGLRMEFMRWR